jgi:hypothetical protein
VREYDLSLIPPDAPLSPFSPVGERAPPLGAPTPPGRPVGTH